MAGRVNKQFASTYIYIYIYYTDETQFADYTII